MRTKHFNKCLGTISDHIKLTFNNNTEAIFKKCRKRLFLLRKVRNMDMNSDMLYRISAAFSFISWFGGCSVKNKQIQQSGERGQ